MQSTSLLPLVAGGAAIGCGAALLLLGSGHIAGISGITANLLQGRRGPGDWRPWFLVGLLLPALWLVVGDTRPAGTAPSWLLALAGLLVGLGTRLGTGCTSGHGVCGIANLSLRSLAATLTFMAVAMATVYLVRHGATA
ncbi:YeeE/YedE family protein [Chitinivorax sp. PXF-14]|uniref:YeeE/YedE family protein n=1 Tax=Chitinivorax sp. PXF-14 TaxID=3230488 RepID=UPI00346773AE